MSWLRIVGVAPDLVYEELGEQTEQSRLNLYVPYAMHAPRTHGDPGAEQPATPARSRGPARDALRRVHAGLPVYDIRTMAEVRRFTTWEQQFFGTMMGAFAGTALLLACLGVYALLAYAARRRTHEIGVRLALGAEPRDVVALFVRQAGGIGALGLAIGLVLADGRRQALERTDLRRRRLRPVDVRIRPAVCLLAVVFAAAYLPARRAARLDPTRAPGPLNAETRG